MFAFQTIKKTLAVALAHVYYMHISDQTLDPLSHAGISIAGDLSWPSGSSGHSAGPDRKLITARYSLQLEGDACSRPHVTIEVANSHQQSIPTSWVSRCVPLKLVVATVQTRINDFGSISPDRPEPKPRKTIRGPRPSTTHRASTTELQAAELP